MKEHDKTAFRLASILIKLNEGEHPSIEELAEEYNVHKRTIQRDINELSLQNIRYGRFWERLLLM